MTSFFYLKEPYSLQLKDEREKKGFHNKPSTEMDAKGWCYIFSDPLKLRKKIGEKSSKFIIFKSCNLFF